MHENKEVINSNYRISQLIVHQYITNLLRLSSSIHEHETRHNKLCLSHVNTRFGQRILRYKGSQLWNRVPSNLTNSTFVCLGGQFNERICFSGSLLSASIHCIHCNISIAQKINFD